MKNKKLRKTVIFLVSIAIPLLAGFIGSISTSGSVSTWYQTINKPSFNPPDWVFGPVWTTLFILMGISLYIIWSKGLKKKGVKKALGIFGVQLALNILWSFLFFGLKSPLYGLIEIVILWAAILYTIILFSRVSRTASYLLIPYILWVSFAAVLNFTIFVLN
ncbi:tryptophan-rich sensory protein [Candidatus Woesearchaeota archaeon]|nr:tryptophan-rich sensory protein [Candidatus Woesearchaeota archaeon]